MKTVRGYKTSGQLFVQGHTDLVAKVGDIVRLYLDQVADPELPEYISATVEHPIVVSRCGTRATYGFEYDEDDLGDASQKLRSEDITDVLVFSTVGRSAYESYLLTTNDDPPLTEEQWATTMAGSPRIVSVYPPLPSSSEVAGVIFPFPYDGLVWYDPSDGSTSTWTWRDPLITETEEDGYFVSDFPTPATAGVPDRAYVEGSSAYVDESGNYYISE
jgi:hypothetical protein